MNDKKYRNFINIRNSVDNEWLICKKDNQEKECYNWVNKFKEKSCIYDKSLSIRLSVSKENEPPARTVL